jgi:hypothetical protein
MVIHNGGVLWPILAFFATFNTLRNRCSSGGEPDKRRNTTIGARGNRA